MKFLNVIPLETSSDRGRILQLVVKSQLNLILRGLITSLLIFSSINTWLEKYFCSIGCFSTMILNIEIVISSSSDVRILTNDRESSLIRNLCSNEILQSTSFR